MPGSNEISLKEALQKLIDTYKLRGKLNENKLVNSWEKIMGKMIANHTREIYLDGGTLHIRLDSSTLRNELFYAKDKIKEKINQEMESEVVKKVLLR